MSGASKKPVPLRFRWEQCVRLDARVTGTNLMVLLCMATYANADGTNIWVGEQQVAANTGTSSRTVRRGISCGIAAGYIDRLQRGHRLGNGTAASSQYRLVLPFPVAAGGSSTGQGCPVELVSTGHQGPIEAVSTGQIEHLNRTQRVSQPDTGVRLPCITKDDHASGRAAGCGRCDETRHITQVDDTGKPTVIRCPSCHPKAVPA